MASASSGAIFWTELAGGGPSANATEYNDSAIKERVTTPDRCIDASIKPESLVATPFLIKLKKHHVLFGNETGFARRDGLKEAKTMPPAIIAIPAA